MNQLRCRCLLCGYEIVSGDGDDFGRSKFNSNYHALYATSDDWNSPKLSSVVDVSQEFTQNVKHGVMVIPREDEFDIDVSDHIFEERFVKYRVSPTVPSDFPSLHLWGFAIHADCWRLLCEVNDQMGEQHHIRALFDLCVSQPNVSSAVDWFHQYGGHLKRDYPNAFQWPGEVCCPGTTYTLENTGDSNGLSPLENEFLQRFRRTGEYPPTEVTSEVIPQAILYRNMTRYLGLRHGEKEEEGRQPPYTDLPDNSFGPLPGPLLRLLSQDTRDPFQHLPHELLTEILVSTPSKDIKNLRLASKTVATLDLPERFWRSRFLNGNEFSYLYSFASCWPEPKTWAEKYEKAMRYHKYRKAIDYLREPDAIMLHHRKRVWELGEYLSRLIELRLSFQHCCPQVTRIASGAGHTYREGGGWLSAHIDLIPFNVQPKGGFRRLLKDEGGSRQLFEDAISIPIGEAVMEVSVSLVSLHGGTSLSGLTFGPKYQVGYDNYRSRESATWSGSKRVPGAIRGFHLALDSHSLRGIRIYCVPGGLSDWIGDHENLAKQAIVHSAGSLQKVELGLNALHAVSLSIFNQDSQDIVSVPNQDAQDIVSISNKDLQDVVTISSQDSQDTVSISNEDAQDVVSISNQDSQDTDRTLRNAEWDPFQTCLFGGVDGQKLPEVTQIVFSMTEVEEWEPSPRFLELFAIINYTRINYIKFLHTPPVEGRGTQRARASDSSILGLGAYYDEQCNGSLNHRPTAGGPIRDFKLKITPDRRLGEHLVGVDAIYHRGHLETRLNGLIIYTSCGRSIEVPPGISDIASDPDLETVRIRPEGGKIVGICSQLSRSKFIKNIGLLVAPEK
ncbi:unnamed protein product, partial [Clonostachys byssicola]